MRRFQVILASSLLMYPTSVFAQAKPRGDVTISASQSTAADDASQDLVRMEEPQVGDHWTFESRDEIKGEVTATLVQTVTDVTPAVVSLRVALLGGFGANYLNFDRWWNLTDNGPWRYAPHDGTGIRAPLAIGKSWAIKASDQKGGIVLWKRVGMAKVTGQERVTTRAGTFDTFRIETSIQLQSPLDPTKKGQVLQQTWYAPDINHWVKRTYESRLDGRVRERSSAELLEYGRRD